MKKTRSPRNKVTIQDSNDLRKYRTELPNLIDDLDLSPTAYRLYGHYKRRAGAAGGECTEGLRGIAKHCKMSINTVRKGRDELLERRLIQSHPFLDAKGNHEHISIVNIWPENFRRYAQEGVSEFDTGGVSNETQGVSPDDTGGVSASDTEERTIRKEVTNEEEKPPSPHARLMDFLQTKYGSVANGAKEGKAIKWLVAHYDPVECIACFEFLAAQDWRTSQISWVTVQSQIGAFITRAEIGTNGNGHKPKTASERNVANIHAALTLFQGQSRPIDSQEPIGLLAADTGANGNGFNDRSMD